MNTTRAKITALGLNTCKFRDNPYREIYCLAIQRVRADESKRLHVSDAINQIIEELFRSCNDNDRVYMLADVQNGEFTIDGK